MKLIVRNFDPFHRLLRYFHHADPDELLRLSAREGNATADDARSKFSLILHDTRIAGVWKRTAHGRLESTQRAIGQYLKRKRRVSINALDVGASDGTTTIDLLEYLKSQDWFRINAWLADKYLWLHRFERGPVVEYRAADGAPALARVGRVALRLPRSEHFWHFPARLMAAGYMRLEGFRASMTMTGKIRLLNPLLDEYPEIQIIEFDCLQRRADIVGQMDVIRVSNLLNLPFFAKGEVMRCIENLHAYLREDGCMVVSRNVDRGKVEIEEGSLWRKTVNGFALEIDFGGGSEIKPIVAALSVS